MSVFLASGQLAIFAGFFGNVASAAPAQGSPQRSHATTSKPLTPHLHLLGGPDLGISVTTGAASYNVGNTVSYTLTINNADSAGPILLGTPVTFTDLAALGLSNLNVTSTSGWSFSVSSTTSPSLITGTYTGAYPIAAGQTLPSVTVTGTANGAVLGLLANVATVTVLGDLNLSNNSATVDVSILNAPTPTIPVPSVTATVAVPSVTSTVAVPSVTSTVAVPSVTSTVAVPSVTSTVAVPTVTATVAVPSVTATLPVPTDTTTVTVPTVTSTVAVPSATVTIPVPTVTTTVTVPTATTTVTVPTVTTTVPVPSVTATVTAPDLNISQTITGGTTFQVGQTINYALQVGNSPTAGPVISPNPVTITEVIPLGLTNLTASGTGWNVVLSSTTSPALLTATYTGTYPINAGVALSLINISGVATVDGIPSITTSANVNTPGDLNLLDNTSTATVTILASLTPTSTVTVPTATTTVTVPSVTATIPVPSVTTTVTVPTATVTIPVPSVTATTVPTLTTTVTVPTATVTIPVPSVTATATAPYLTLGQTVLGGLTYQAGQTVSYSLQANVGVNGGAETNSITVSEVLPLGLTNIAASGTNWSVTLSDTTSPAVLTAVYVGSYPIAAGTSLPALNISGVLTVDAIPSLTTTATVSSLDNIDVLNNSATATILVAAGVSTPTATTTVTVPTATTTVTVPTLTTTVTVPSVTATVVPTLTTTVTVPTVTATISVPSVTATVVPTLTTTITVPSVTATIPVPSVTATVVPTLTTTVTVPTVTVTVPVPSVTATVVPTLTATPTLPNVSIALTNQGGTTFQVGQTVTFSIQVTNELNSGNLARSNRFIPLGVRSISTAKANTPILVTAVLPLGLSNIVTSGTGWNITNSASTSPSAITAQYNGAYPIVPGQNLPVITISGTLTSNAGPIFTAQAALLVPGNTNTTTITSVDSITVQSAPTPTATTTVTVPTPTTTITVPTATTTVTVPTPTTTVTVPTVTATVPVPSVTATVTVPTPTVTIPVPSVTATVTVPTPTPTPVSNPDLSITATLLGSVNAQVGQTVTYSLQVSDAANAGAVITPNSINLTDILPLGLNGIQVTGTGWQVNTSSTISPAVVTAIYTGNYPVLPGASLPTLIISGTLTSTAVPSFTTTASVNVPGDINYANNLATVTVLVSSALTPTATPTVVPTSTVTVPTITATVVPTSTVTVPTITATVIPTSTVTVPTITATVVPTSTVTVPTVTPTTVPTITPTPGIDLGIAQNVQGGLSVQVGHNAIFALQVQSAANAGIVTRPDSIIVTDILPLGLSNIQAAGNNWIINASATTSPTVITAVYNGIYPVVPGATLPPIIITGVLNANAVPMFTSTASVNIPNDVNYLNNLAVSTLSVSPLPTPTATIPVPTPTVTLPSHLLMSISAPNFSNFTVGQNANYSLVVSNLSNAGSVQAGSTIRVHDLLPTGLTNISASGNGWTITITGTTGPALLTATYTGAYPVLPGTALPPIVITGTVINSAVPTLTNTASVSSTGNNNAANNTAILTLPVFLP